MAAPATDAIVLTSADRLFLPVWNAVQIMSGLLVGSVILASRQYNPKDEGGEYSYLLDKMLIFPLGGIIEHGVNNTHPVRVSLTIASGPFAIKPRLVDSNADTLSYHHKLTSLATSIVFANFFENYLLDFRDTWGANPQGWPTVINFARVVRNATAHGGKVHFEKSTSPGVVWQGMSYSPSDNGRRVVGGDLLAADFVFLMMEVSRELDAAGVRVQI